MSTPTIFYILSPIYLVTLVIIGIYLIIRAIRTNLTNLWWLGTTLLLMVLDFILINFNLVPLFLNIIVNSCFFTLLFFIHTTFYKNLKSLVWYLFFIMLVLKFADFILRLEFPFSTPLTYSLPQDQRLIYWIWFTIVRLISIIPVGWLLYTSVNAYNNWKKKDIEPWIQTRYLLLAMGTGAYLMQTPILFFLPLDGEGFAQGLGLILGIVLLIINLIFATTYLFAWIMPEWLKEILNQGYQLDIEKDEPLSEEQLMKQLMEDNE